MIPLILPIGLLAAATFASSLKDRSMVAYILAVLACGLFIWGGKTGGIWQILITPLGFFAVVGGWWHSVRNIAPLVLIPLTVVALVCAGLEFYGIAPVMPSPMPSYELPAMVVAHIITAGSAYGALAVAAAAGTGVLVREHALRLKKPAPMPNLPSVTQTESVEIKLLVFAALMLVLAVASGSLALNQQLWQSDHTQKAIFAILALAVALVSLALRWLASSRGARLARMVLVAWVLLTLAWLLASV